MCNQAETSYSARCSKNMQKMARSRVHFYEKKLLLVLIEGIFEKKIKKPNKSIRKNNKLIKKTKDARF